MERVLFFPVYLYSNTTLTDITRKPDMKTFNYRKVKYGITAVERLLCFVSSI